MLGVWTKNATQMALRLLLGVLFVRFSFALVRVPSPLVRLAERKCGAFAASCMRF